MRWLVALTVAALLAVLARSFARWTGPTRASLLRRHRVFPVSPASLGGRSGLWRPDRRRGRRLAVTLMERVANAAGPCTTTSSGGPALRRRLRPRLPVAPADRSLRRLLRGLRRHARGGAIRVRPEPAARQPQLPHLHVVSGRSPTWRAEACSARKSTRHSRELRPAAPVRARLDLLPHVSRESRPPGVARSAWGDPAPLPGGFTAGILMSLVFVRCTWPRRSCSSRARSNPASVLSSSHSPPCPSDQDRRPPRHRRRADSPSSTSRSSC